MLRLEIISPDTFDMIPDNSFFMYENLLYRKSVGLFKKLSIQNQANTVEIVNNIPVTLGAGTKIVPISNITIKNT